MSIYALPLSLALDHAFFTRKFALVRSHDIWKIHTNIENWNMPNQLYQGSIMSMKVEKT